MTIYFKTIVLVAGIAGVLAFTVKHVGTETNSKMQSLKNDASIKTEEVTYMSGGKQCRGYIAYDESIQGKRPIVVVVPEWWGVNDYTKSRARQLAALGYFAIDADPYGSGKIAANPQEAMAYAKPYYIDPTMSKSVVEDAAAKAATFSQADNTEVAAIGYCFGGFVILNAAKLGAPLKAVVLFHGGLGGVQPKKGVTQADILVCQGADDQFVTEADRAAFKKSMDSVGAHYTFIEYPGATHAFSNPNATAVGKQFNMPIAYNGAADTASWQAMKTLLAAKLK